MGDSENIVGVFEKTKPKITSTGRNLQENVFRSFSKMLKNRSKFSYWKIDILKKLSKNPPKILEYIPRLAHSKNIMCLWFWAKF